MSQVLVFSATTLTGFFAIMNPIGNTPIYLSLVGDLSESDRRRVALHSVVLAFAIVGCFAIGSSIIFKLFGITLPAFQIAGGILIFFVGYQLLHGRQSAIHHPPASERDETADASEIAITPLAVPILAGPGTVSTAMNFVGAHSSVLYTAVVVVMFGIICAATYLAFISGEKIVSRIKPGIIKVVTRLMGLIITVISVQMVITGVGQAVTMYK
jgi:multiple antibiotic resistance protein